MRWRTLTVVGWALPPLACAAIIVGGLAWSARDVTGEPAAMGRASGAAASVPVALASADVAVEAPTAVADAQPAALGSTPSTRIVLLGDSLAQEAQPVLQYLVAPVEVVPKYWGGTAPCDWLDVDLDADPATTVVITFTGNSLTPCMDDGAGGHLADHALVDRYRLDVTMLVERALAAGGRVVLIGQPVRAAKFDADIEVAGINEAYRALAADLAGVSFFDAGAAVEAPDGSFAERLPCTPYDSDCAADGMTVVRGDGVHFCPVPGRNPCPVWSAGALRFALGIAAALQHAERYD
ncbi:MAG: hypothetical protein HZB15_09665 [Actinobacteria bacterium]|nr:hypothetical protein [Actinomycetota bacterium]